MKHAAIAVIAVVLSGMAGAAGVANAGEQAEAPLDTYSIGAFIPSFTPPAAGTYGLPPIGDVGEHPLVDASGQKTSLLTLLDDSTAVVSFFYGTCSEKTGCPLSTAVLHRLDERISSRPEVARRTRLISISFDPTHDTTERLSAMQRMRAAGSTWSFATAPDEASLESLLADFGQTVTKLRTNDGAWNGSFRHVLKVYLVDRSHRVRNIYSVGFLSPDLVWNDLETLRMEEAPRGSR